MPPTSPVPQGTPQPNYYEILQISPATLDSQTDPSQALKRAYHRALLIHHPDKQRSPSAAPSTSTTTPPAPPPSSRSTTVTIDQISTAYSTLSSARHRAEYDKQLLLLARGAAPNREAGPGSGSGGGDFQTGVETVDLDDLAFDPDAGEWYRPCRCGNPRGYRFAEADLEDAAVAAVGGGGEVVVGCRDCSLWLRVHFAVVEEDGEEVEGGGGGGDGHDDGHGRQGGGPRIEQAAGG